MAGVREGRVFGQEASGREEMEIFILDGADPFETFRVLVGLQPGLEFRPTGKGVIVRDDELNVGESQWSLSDLFRGEELALWVQFLDESQRGGFGGLKTAEQGFRLLLEVLQAGSGG